MPKIQVLDKHTAELIAAGEVVERPSSVVKELLENTIDAGATSVTVEIKNGGITYIGITDNGCGIAREDVPTAFLRHATSKVRTEADLDAIGTLGFRGEALASIAAVARVELTTCAAGEVVGTRYILEGGEEISLEDAARPQGTTIVVRDLFYNVPARMKFLKKDVGEGNSVAGVVDRIALSHPEVSVRFLRDGREELLTPGDGNLRSCIYAVFGRDFSSGLLPVNYTLDGISVQGFVSKPTNSRSNRTMQHFFINGRYVKSMTAAAALEQAFKGSIMTGKFPACVLLLEMPPETVDVNVHPAKIEVRFINEKPVFSAVYHGVMSALQAGDAPKQAVFQPQPIKAPQVNAEQLRMPMPPRTASEPPKTARTVASAIAARPVIPEPPLSAAAPVKPAASSSGFTKRPLFPEEDKPASVGILRDGGAGWTDSRPAVNINITRTAPAAPANAESPGIVSSPIAVPPSAAADKLAETEAPTDERVVTCLGEAFCTYIVAELDGSLFFIDKHAAHERLLYNQLKSAEQPQAQLLLAPVSVLLSKEEYTALMAEPELLEQAGFEVEDFGGSTVLVRAVPMLLTGCDIAGTLQEIAGGLAAGKHTVVSEKLDWIYHSTACRAAVKAGDISKPPELQAMAERILLNDDIRYCPHGRPVCFELTRRELEKQFGRIV